MSCILKNSQTQFQSFISVYLHASLEFDPCPSSHAREKIDYLSGICGPPQH